MADANALPNSYENLYQEALSLSARGDREHSLALLRRIVDRLLTLSPATLERHADMAALGIMAASRAAHTLASLGLYDDAVAMQRNALRFRSGQTVAVEIGVAGIRAREGRLSEARDTLLATADEHADQYAIWAFLAYVQAKMGDDASADASIAKAEAVASDPEAKLAVAMARFHIATWRGAVEQAVAAWDGALAAHSSAVAAQSSLYAFLLQHGETTRLRRYVDADPVPARAGLMRGILAQRDGDYTEARRHWERVTELNPTQMVAGRLDWAEAAMRCGQMQKAAAVISSRPVEMQTSRVALLAAILAAAANRLTTARELLGSGADMLAETFPWERRYGFAEWDLFTSLVDNRQAWTALKGFFDTQGGAA